MQASRNLIKFGIVEFCMVESLPNLQIAWQHLKIWHAYFAIDMSNLESLKFWMSPDFSWSMVQFWLHVTVDQWKADKG